ncbi:HTH domain-containing protein [Paenibacillus sacheonensis]|uniref:HTH domain-containing protein n=1 Tax=Paenibacillus sacheonensis TaxID=742054 RepID=A0A7X4YQS7_9BACL|nr:HTH domain-containing protein [Paenibacillus sacheonensis]MBM7567923.1 hypothetical protein [Paenibacillus sacheonensis]NBC70808.1 HTH domain-containing protein [Paenibacillus sacheonensis]
MHPVKVITFEKIKKAISSLKKSKESLSINKIAKKAGIERKTIYNNLDILEYCRQEISIQKEPKSIIEKIGINIEEPKKPSGRELLEDRYHKLKDELSREKEKNELLLYKMNELVLVNSDLRARIDSLEQYILQMKGGVIPLHLKKQKPTDPV